MAEWLTDKGTIATGAIGVTALGVVIREWILGVIQTIQTFGAGLDFAIGGPGSFASTLIPSVFAETELVVSSTLGSTARWIAETFGILSIPVSIIVIATIVWILSAAVIETIRWIAGGI